MFIRGIFFGFSGTFSTFELMILWDSSAVFHAVFFLLDFRKLSHTQKNSVQQYQPNATLCTAKTEKFKKTSKYLLMSILLGTESNTLHISHITAKLAAHNFNRMISQFFINLDKSFIIHGIIR